MLALACNLRLLARSLAVQVIQYVPPRRTAWIGVELDRAVGDSDGTLEGERYFQCKPQHGVFVREEQLQVLVSSSMGCGSSCCFA